MKINLKYLAAFFILFIVEVIIAIFVHDTFIRPYGGDIIVVILIYCFIKVFLSKKIKLLPFYVFLFAACVEFAQYFKWLEIMGLSNNKLARIVLGTSFSWIDIVCYFFGCFGIFLFELYQSKKSPA